MRDLLGNEIQKNDVVVFANDVGYLSLALVSEIDEDAKTLIVKKRGYREAKMKELHRPTDVIVVTEQIKDVRDVEDTGRPEEVQTIVDMLEEIRE